MPKFPLHLPNGSVGSIAGNINELDAALAEILIEIAVETGNLEIEITDEVRDEMLYRLAARGFDIATGERTVN